MEPLHQSPTTIARPGSSYDPIFYCDGKITRRFTPASASHRQLQLARSSHDIQAACANVFVTQYQCNEFSHSGRWNPNPDVACTKFSDLQPEANLLQKCLQRDVSPRNTCEAWMRHQQRRHGGTQCPRRPLTANERLGLQEDAWPASTASGWFTSPAVQPELEHSRQQFLHRRHCCWRRPRGALGGTLAKDNWIWSILPELWQGPLLAAMGGLSSPQSAIIFGFSGTSSSSSLLSPLNRLQIIFTLARNLMLSP